MTRFSLILLLLCILLGLNACTLSKSTSVEEVTVEAGVRFEPNKDFLKNTAEINTQEEDVIGRAVAARILGNIKPLKNPTLNAYVNTVGQAIVAASTRSETFSGYTFLVLDSEEVTAMAAPGGYIFISVGFLRLLPDEDALAAVLAHEVTHVSKKHGLMAIKPTHLADYVEVGAAMGSALDCTGISAQLLVAYKGAISDVYEALVVAGYSQDQEYEADSGALLILESAGYKPEALQLVLRILEKRNSKGGWFSTHPKPKDRLKIVGARVPVIAASKLGYEDRKKRFLVALASL